MQARHCLILGGPPITAIKAAPNGKKLAISCFDIDANIHASNPRIEIYDFNSFTGIVNNPTIIKLPDNDNPLNATANFISFSPNSKKMYCNQTLFTGTRFYQFDISTSSSPLIITSQDTVAIILDRNFFIEAMQLGSDGKVYIFCSDTNTIAVINNPNNAGTHVI